MSRILSDIAVLLGKMESGLSNYMNNEEAIELISSLKEQFRLDAINVVIVYYGDCIYRPEDRFSNIKINVNRYNIKELPTNYLEFLHSADIVFFTFDSQLNELNRELRLELREATRSLNNIIAVYQKDLEREVSTIITTRRNLYIPLENSKMEIQNILRKLAETVDIAVFKLAKNKAVINQKIDLLDFIFRELGNNAVAKSIITAGEFLEIQIGDVRVLGKQQSILRNKLSKSFKSITIEAEHKNEEFFSTYNPIIKELRSKIESYNGFKSISLTKAVSLKMTEEFQNEIYSEFRNQTANYIANLVNEVKDSVGIIRQELDEALTSIDISHKLTKEETLEKGTIDRLLDSTTYSVKDHERTYNTKGMNQLFTELRAPLFMLMPVLMLFMLFKPITKLFTKIGEKDFIDRSITESNGIPTIKVVGHPRYEKIEEIFETLFDDIKSEINGKEVKSSPFYIKGNLVIQYEESGDKNRPVKTPIIKTDEEAVYIMLHTDREEVLEKFEQTYLMEAPKKSSSTTAGMGVIFKFIQNLPYAEYVLLVLLFIVGYFIWKKIEEFRKEETIDVLDAKKTIRTNFLTDFDRYLSTVQSKWKSSQDTWIRNIQESFLADLENCINSKIDNETKKLQELKGLYDKRTKIFKDNEKELKDFELELRKVKAEFNNYTRL
jgi:F0F1-type ATP synthase membrane subunit b/b'